MKYEAAFYLDNRKLPQTFVIMAVTCSDGRLKYSTGLKIAPKDWPADLKQLPPGPLKDRITEMTKMVSIKSYFNPFFKGKKDISKERIKKDLDASYGKVPKTVAKTKANNGNFEADSNKIISMIRKGDALNPFTGTAYSKNYLVSMEGTQKDLLAFQKEKGISMAFETTNENTYNEFIKYLNEQGFRLSSINTKIIIWKSLAEHARNHLKVKISDWFDNKRFKTVSAKITRKISLSDTDIKKLLALELSGSDKEIRDRFVMNCDNGLRISDWNSVKNEDIKNGIVNIITKKKNKEIASPITKLAKNIMAEYDGKLPKSHFYTHINNRIKQIAKDAGIDDIIIFSEVIGGQLVKQKKFKWELISNHTARRTFVTRARAAGVDTNDFNHLNAMSPAMVARYDKISAKETAQKVKGNPFFS